jgi:hypothetical protein
MQVVGGIVLQPGQLEPLQEGQLLQLLALPEGPGQCPTRLLSYAP